MLDKSIRELDRERVGLQNQEKKLILEIKKAAKQGQMVQHMDMAGCFGAGTLSTDRRCVCGRMQSRSWPNHWSGIGMQSQKCTV